MTKPYLRYLNMICILIYIFESAIGIATVTISDIRQGVLDFDYLMLLIFMILYKLKQTWYKYALSTLVVSYVYSIDQVEQADKYMEYLAILFKQINDKNARLNLFTLLKAHYSNCSDKRCLCFLLKYYVRESKDKCLIDQMAKYEKSKNDLKLILYDDEVAMSILLKEHQASMIDPTDDSNTVMNS